MNDWRVLLISLAVNSNNCSGTGENCQWPIVVDENNSLYISPKLAGEELRRENGFTISLSQHKEEEVTAPV